jgi:hypothetical protein
MPRRPPLQTILSTIYFQSWLAFVVHRTPYTPSGGSIHRFLHRYQYSNSHGRVCCKQIRRQCAYNQARRDGVARRVVHGAGEVVRVLGAVSRARARALDACSVVAVLVGPGWEEQVAVVAAVAVGGAVTGNILPSDGGLRPIFRHG